MSTASLDAIAPALHAHGIALSPQQGDLVARYAALLERWNQRINLIGTRDPQVLWRRHVLDCLMLASIAPPRSPCTWLDVGSGAGLPAVLLAILHPADRVLAVETVAKKATFLHEVARTLPLPNLLPLRRDVHTLADDPTFEGCDAVVARAFASLPDLLALAVPLLRPDGELWAMKGRRWEEEAAQIPSSVQAAYAPQPRVHAYRLAPGEDGCIVIYRRHAAFAPHPPTEA